MLYRELIAVCWDPYKTRKYTLSAEYGIVKC
jgi:hypothetical protein